MLASIAWAPVRWVGDGAAPSSLRPSLWTAVQLISLKLQLIWCQLDENPGLHIKFNPVGLSQLGDTQIGISRSTGAHCPNSNSAANIRSNQQLFKIRIWLRRISANTNGTRKCLGPLLDRTLDRCILWVRQRAFAI
jgi:hypothetical protein